MLLMGVKLDDTALMVVMMVVVIHEDELEVEVEDADTVDGGQVGVNGDDEDDDCDEGDDSYDDDGDNFKLGSGGC